MRKIWNSLGAMKNIVLLLASTVYTITDCIAQPLRAWSNDAPVVFQLPLADLNAGDASVVFVLNHVPTEGVGNSGGWNYIITRVASTSTAETRATNTLTFTTGGTAGDTLNIQITTTPGVANGQVQTINFGTITSAGGSVTAAAVLAKNLINGGSATHGFTAANAAGVLTISAPAGSGASPNTVTPVLTFSTGATLAVTNTAFASGVTAVYTASEVKTSMQPHPVKPGQFINANIKELNDAIAAYQAYQYHSW